MKEKPNQELLDAMSRNSDNWQGVFYFNKKDPRLMVPKYIPSMGWTINFGHRYAIIALLGILGVLFFAVFFSN